MSEVHRGTLLTASSEIASIRLSVISLSTGQTPVESLHFGVPRSKSPWARLPFGEARRKPSGGAVTPCGGCWLLSGLEPPSNNTIDAVGYID